MLIRHITGFSYFLVIIFNNGAVEKLDNIFDFYIDTDSNTLYISVIDDEAGIWDDSYDIENIKELKVVTIN